MRRPIDPAEVRAAAADISVGFGISAEMEAQRRIMEANSKGDAQQAAFWQEVSRALVSAAYRYSSW
jgi:hypothetical protein